MKTALLTRVLAPAAAATIALAGCVDEQYDLSDIDTSVRLRVTDLTVPVNLAPITLSTILDLDNGSVVKTVNGEYAVLIEGDFASDEVSVPAVVLAHQSIAPIHTLMPPGTGAWRTVPPLGQGETAVTYAVPQVSTTFRYTTWDVSKCIRSLEGCGAQGRIDVTLTIDDATGVFGAVSVSGLRFELPAGITTAVYANEGGTVTIPDFTLDAGVRSHTVSIPVAGLDFARLNASQYTFTPDADAKASGYLSLQGAIGVAGGYVTGALRPGAQQPQSLGLTVAPATTDFTITSFTGRIQYYLDTFAIPPVQLDDLPELLTDPGTNLVLVNPQLYLSINNPMGGYGADVFSSLTLTPWRGDVQGAPCSPDGRIAVGHGKGVEGPYDFCLSPTAPGAWIAGFTPGEHVPYGTLSGVLSGRGLPSSIGVDLNDCYIGSAAGPARVADFRLGETLPKAQGRYTFYAPLQLGAGTCLGYENTDDGWLDEDMEDLVVERVRLRANVYNSLPFDITLKACPLTRGGLQCTDPATQRPVSFTPVTVKAGATSAIDLDTDGTVTALDGIRYEATGYVPDDAPALSPSITITLSDIRVTVSGYYDTTI